MNTPSKPYPRRGEVYWLDFDPSTGAEIRGLHPAIIIQNDRGNRAGMLTIVVAVTGNLKVARLPVGVFIPAGVGGLKKDSVANCGQIYTVDQSRLGARIGMLPITVMAQVAQAIRTSLEV
jgi:mRNA interferase MazF